MDRRAWTREEDNAIEELVNKFGIKKWTTISEKMEKSYCLSPRSGKQCRERWYNHLDPTINKQEWTQEEEMIIFKAHRKYGNKWADISKYLVGRTDNSIKNHFYSTLRKSLRRINKYLGDKNSTVQVKEIKPGVLSKLFSLIEQNYSDSDESYKKLIQHSDNLKDCLFNFAQLKPQKSKTSQQHENLKMIIEKINEFKFYINQIVNFTKDKKKADQQKKLIKIKRVFHLIQKTKIQNKNNIIKKIIFNHSFKMNFQEILNKNIFIMINFFQIAYKKIKIYFKLAINKKKILIQLILKAQEFNDIFYVQQTPIQNNMLQQILYCNGNQENGVEDTLQQNGIANSPFQSVQYTKNNNIVPITPKIEFGENWSKQNTDLQKNFELIYKQDNLNLEFKQQKNDKLNQMVLELKNNIDRNQDKRNQEDFLHSPQSSFQFFQKKD